MKPIEFRPWLGRRIREARDVTGWKQYALSKATGIPQSTLSEIENGIDPLDAEDLLAISRATEMPLSFFDPNHRARHIAEAVLAEYPDMPLEYVRSIETTARMLYREFRSSQSSAQTNRSFSADSGGNSGKQ